MDWNSQLVALVPEKWLDIWGQNSWSNAAWDVRELLDICTCTVLYCTCTFTKVSKIASLVEI